METLWRFLKELTIKLPHDPAIPFLGTHLEKMKTLIRKDICTATFIEALSTIAKTWKQPKCPPRGTGFRRCGVYIYTDIQWNIPQLLKKRIKYFHL